MTPLIEFPMYKIIYWKSCFNQKYVHITEVKWVAWKPCFYFFIQDRENKTQQEITDLQIITDKKVINLFTILYVYFE